MQLQQEEMESISTANQPVASTTRRRRGNGYKVQWEDMEEEEKEEENIFFFFLWKEARAPPGEQRQRMTDVHAFVGTRTTGEHGSEV